MDVLPSHRQDGHRVRVEWGQAGIRLLAGAADLVVIVDVLSFSTAVSIAVERGVTVFPCRDRHDGLRSFAAAVGATHVADPDRRAAGPTLSPRSLLDLPRGARLVLPSPNGSTCAALATESGMAVVSAGLRDATAVGRFAAAHGGTVAVIPAGEHWPDGGLRPAIEDLIAAGAVALAVVTALDGDDADVDAALSPEAKVALAAFEDARDELPTRLAASASGRELIDRGFAGDVSEAARLDVSDVVPVLVDGAFEGRSS